MTGRWNSRRVHYRPDIAVAALREFLSTHTAKVAHARTLWVGLTGSHTYGFPSPDSDIDLKGIHVFPAASLLGLSSPTLSYDFLGDWQGREFDFTLNELGKAASLILSGNGNVLERMLGPMPVLTTPHGTTFMKLVQGALSKRFVKHYLGFFRGMQREAEVEAKAQRLSAKTLLYAYRVPLTGIHLLRTGTLETNVQPLAQHYGWSMVATLVDVKSKAEFETVPPDLLDTCRSDFRELETELQAALHASNLPDEAENRNDIERFIIDRRLELTHGD